MELLYVNIPSAVCSSFFGAFLIAPSEKDEGANLLVLQLAIH